MLKLDVAKYVQSNFVHYSQNYMVREEVCQVRNLTDFPEDNDLEKSFADKLMELLINKDISNVDCYKRANIDKKLFSKIINGSMPKKRTVLALCIALKLNLSEAKSLLNCAGYSLSHSFKLDLIVEYFIVNRKYDIFEVNEVLFDNDLPLLGSI